MKLSKKLRTWVVREKWRFSERLFQVRALSPFSASPTQMDHAHLFQFLPIGSSFVGSLPHTFVLQRSTSRRSSYPNRCQKMSFGLQVASVCKPSTNSIRLRTVSNFIRITEDTWQSVSSRRLRRELQERGKGLRGRLHKCYPSIVAISSSSEDLCSACKFSDGIEDRVVVGSLDLNQCRWLPDEIAGTKPEPLVQRGLVWILRGHT